MQVSTVNYCECRRIDFGHLLFSPEFFMDDKLKLWNDFEDKSTNASFDYFEHVRDTVQQINQPSICYDLTDGLPKFLDKELETTSIGSTKKIAQPNDFVISRLRSYLEEMAIVEDKQSPQLFSTEFLIFRAKTEKISTHTLFALCMTKQVQAILKRGQYGTEHPRFYEFLLTNLPIPDYLLMIDSYIVKYINDSVKIRKESKIAYKQAQDLLLAELGLDDWQPKHELTYSKCYSETVQAGRIDAEYYQPKYDEIIKAIKGYKGGYSTVGKEFIQNKTTFQIEDDKLYQYVEIGSVNVSSGEIVPEKVLGVDAPANAKRILHKNDVIISKVRTYRGAITIVEKQGYVGSGAFTILAENGKVNKETLLAFLHSKPLLAWSLKPNTGASYPVIKDDDILNLPIPIILKDKQLEIQEKVMESFKLRERSKTLLENAKRAVEIAIEQDETAAIQFLNSET